MFSMLFLFFVFAAGGSIIVLAISRLCPPRRMSTVQPAATRTASVIALPVNGPVRHPTPKDIVKNLPVVPYSRTASILRLREPCCAICVEPFVEGQDKVKVLPCGHSGFHVACIDQWLARETYCPLCKQSVVPGAEGGAAAATAATTTRVASTTTTTPAPLATTSHVVVRIAPGSEAPSSSDEPSSRAHAHGGRCSAAGATATQAPMCVVPIVQQS